MKLIRYVIFSASHSRINPFFTAGKQNGVLERHLTPGQKTAIVISIVHGKIKDQT
jgi:hypothetical protein